LDAWTPVVVSKNYTSRGRAIVIIQKSADSFALAHRSRYCGDGFHEKTILESLMVALEVIQTYYEILSLLKIPSALNFLDPVVFKIT
jgi:hypothetical protein